MKDTDDEDEDGEQDLGPLLVRCPTCDAGPGERCVSWSRKTHLRSDVTHKRREQVHKEMMLVHGEDGSGDDDAAPEQRDREVFFPKLF